VSAAKFLVGGKVQGVWFRASAREQAVRLGLRGYAKNLDDGRVEVLAIGDDAAIATLEKWLWQGPRLARVEDVVREAVDVAPTVFGFETR
jgi:acylphosphatase